MKKFFLIFILAIFSTVTANAATMKVASLSNFSTLDSSSHIKIYVLEDFYLHPKFLIPEGSVLVGDVINIKEPKRLKKNADFDFLIFYYMDNKQNKYKFQMPICGNYTELSQFDKKKMTKSIAVTVTSHFIPGFNYALNAYEGAKNSSHNKIRGSLAYVYENSIFSYHKKGVHLKLKKYDCFGLVFPKYEQEKYKREKLLMEIDDYGNQISEYKIDGTIKTTSSVEGANLAPNYPTRHQYGKRILYLAHPKKKKSD